MSYVIYVCDTETTGLDSRKNSIIELSLFRLTDNVQKTWTVKPFNQNNIEPEALRINGHKIEDLRLETKFGRETYKDPIKTIVEIENWIMEDGVPTESRFIAGHNSNFDKSMMEQFWINCGAEDSFPFNKRRIIDTMQIEFFLNLCQDSMADSYSLSSLVKKYNVKNDKAHSAESDTKATKEVFEKQIEFFKKILNKK